MLKGGKSGPGLIPGDPDNSLIYRRIVADEMPPAKSILGDSQYVTRVPVPDIETMRRWIAAGAPPTPLRRRTADPVLTEERLKHWAFQPLERPQVPAISMAQQVRNPIDAFLLSRLEDAGITLSAAADPLVLLRRASFALTGLPPSHEDVARVLNEQTPIHIGRMIDRLLESSQYGEHQAVWWLDGAGYADTHGQINRDEFRPFMWRYRDYVIRAFNDDKPYDRFLTEQLAARIASYELAARMQLTATDALDISRETANTHNDYGLNEKETESYGRRCLMARRLVERGVRIVQLYMNTGSSDNPWDHHDDIHGNLTRSCLQTDQPVAALIKDLKRRGLLDSTLLVWGGEFGRLPIAQKASKPGRDHGANGFSIWLAGGGIKGGTVYGATDDFGYHAVENRVSVHDFHATFLHCLGFDHRRLVYNHHGLDERLTGVEPARVVQEVLA